MFGAILRADAGNPGPDAPDRPRRRRSRRRPRYAAGMALSKRDASAKGSVLDDPTYRSGVVELLSLLAYGEISAVEQLALDGRMAPDLRSRVEVAALAASEFHHFEKLRDRLVEMGVDPYESMKPFEAIFQRYHAKTKPSDYYESLLKAYVGDGLASDFYREVAAFLETSTRDLVVETLSGTAHSQFVVDTVRAGIEQDPRIAGRLALWARRLMGEALSQAQTVVAERDALSAVLVGGVDVPGMDLAAIGRMFARITEAHTQRMERLGLAA